ncbi:unnamed protein product [Cochlearia groenlandica]
MLLLVHSLAEHLVLPLTSCFLRHRALTTSGIYSRFNISPTLRSFPILRLSRLDLVGRSRLPVKSSRPSVTLSLLLGRSLAEHLVLPLTSCFLRHRALTTSGIYSRFNISPTLRSFPILRLSWLDLVGRSRLPVKSSRPSLLLGRSLAEHLVLPLTSCFLRHRALTTSGIYSRFNISPTLRSFPILRLSRLDLFGRSRLPVKSSRPSVTLSLLLGRSLAEHLVLPLTSCFLRHRALTTSGIYSRFNISPTLRSFPILRLSRLDLVGRSRLPVKSSRPSVTLSLLLGRSLAEHLVLPLTSCFLRHRALTTSGIYSRFNISPTLRSFPILRLSRLDLVGRSRLPVKSSRPSVTLSLLLGRSLAEHLVLPLTSCFLRHRALTTSGIYSRFNISPTLRSFPILRLSRLDLVGRSRLPVKSSRPSVTLSLLLGRSLAEHLVLPLTSCFLRHRALTTSGIYSRFNISPTLRYLQNTWILQASALNSICTLIASSRPLTSLTPRASAYLLLLGRSLAEHLVLPLTSCFLRHRALTTSGIYSRFNISPTLRSFPILRLSRLDLVGRSRLPVKSSRPSVTLSVPQSSLADYDLNLYLQNTWILQASALNSICTSIASSRPLTSLTPRASAYLLLLGRSLAEHLVLPLTSCFLRHRALTTSGIYSRFNISPTLRSFPILRLSRLDLVGRSRLPVKSSRPSVTLSVPQSSLADYDLNLYLQNTWILQASALNSICTSIASSRPLTSLTPRASAYLVLPKTSCFKPMLMKEMHIKTYAYEGDAYQNCDEEG